MSTIKAEHIDTDKDNILNRRQSFRFSIYVYLFCNFLMNIGLLYLIYLNNNLSIQEKETEMEIKYAEKHQTWIEIQTIKYREINLLNELRLKNKEIDLFNEVKGNELQTINNANQDMMDEIHRIERGMMDEIHSVVTDNINHRVVCLGLCW